MSLHFVGVIGQDLSKLKQSFHYIENQKTYKAWELSDPKVTNNSTSVNALLPVNDNCINALSITPDGNCVNGTMDATNIEPGEVISGGCLSSSLTQSVWYSFVANSSKMYVEIERTTLVSGAAWCPIRFSGIVYDASVCLPGASSIIDCDLHGDDGIIVLNLNALTPGNKYLVQVGYNNTQGCKEPNFCIKIGARILCDVCGSPCGAACGFNFNPTVSQVTSTCPAYTQRPKLEGESVNKMCYTFVANNSTVDFNVILNSNCSNGNVSSFSWTLQRSVCGSILQNGTLASMTMTGLTINTSYTFCYTFTVPANCHHSVHYPYFVGAVPLPIELISLMAFREGDWVKINWATATEKNNKLFEIEKSLDGEQFDRIGTQPGGGNSNSTLHYSFTDEYPGRAVSYYRLKQVDYDGTITFSDIVLVNAIASNEIKISQTPDGSHLFIQAGNKLLNEVNISIIDIGGRLIYTEKTEMIKTGKGRSLLIPTQNLSQGFYVLRVTGSDLEYTGKFFKTTP